jgi:VanZ family protein
MSRRLAVAVLAAYVAALAVATLGASPEVLLQWAVGKAHDFDGLQSLKLEDLDRAGNVLLFIPAGFLLCSSFPAARHLSLWLVCVLVSASVEFVQIALPDREPSLIDVVMNSTGAAIGVVLHVTASRRRGVRSP